MVALISLVAVLALIGIGMGVAAAGGQLVVGVVFPYLAAFLFLGGVIAKVVGWARSPVPFRIPTTCGQQKTLPWIKPQPIENPSGKLGVVVRMALEVLTFRSLFRNTRSEIGTTVSGEKKAVYGPTKWLWLVGLAFHYSFLVVLFRHLRLFTEPVPQAVILVQELDGFFQVGVPEVMMTSLIFVGAVGFLFLRRVVIPQVRYISLAADYFPLFMLLGIGTTGILLRHFFKTDLVGVKELAAGLFSFQPVVPETVGLLFFGHFFLVCCLFAYFPFSKLTHMMGVFLSPTRNMANNNRAVRHPLPENHWDGREIKVHTYQEYEDEFREKMVKAGIPVDKPLEEEA